MEELKKTFLSIGYTEEELNDIINSEYLEKMKTETLVKKVNNIYNYLHSLGYTKKDIIKMTKRFPQIYGLNIETMQQKIEDVQKLGYSKEEVIRITKSLPSIYGYSIETMQQKIKGIEKLGYSKDEVIKMTKSYPAIYRHGIENIQQKIKDIQKLGYSKDEIIKLTKSSPSIYSLSIENMQQKIEDVQKLGYNKEEVLKMTKSFPSIYGLSIEIIQQKIEDIQKLGYSKEEVIKMTKSLPQIYGLSIENIQQKIEFYNSIGLHHLATIDPKNLMQSTKLSYARYMFYKKNGLIIDEQNYYKLFINQKRFESQYGLTKVEILEKYQYPPIKIKEHNLKEEISINPIQAAKSLIKQEGVLTEISIIDKMEKEDKKYEKTNKGEIK